MNYIGSLNQGLMHIMILHNIMFEFEFGCMVELEGLWYIAR